MSAVLASVAAGRSALYWLLADLFLACPDVVLVARLLRDLPGADPGAEATTRELAVLREMLPRAPSAIAALATEYTRLFGVLQRNGGPAPPHESLHRPTQEPATASEFYAKAGLVSFEAGAPPDHLGVELRFMALLCHGESAAWRAGRASQARGALHNERDFLDWHLLAWAPSYLDGLEREARHRFYGVLAGIARRTLHVDRAAIDELLHEAC